VEENPERRLPGEPFRGAPSRIKIESQVSVESPSEEGDGGREKTGKEIGPDLRFT